MFDLVALIAPVVASRLALADRRSGGVPNLGQQVFQAVLYWRAFNLLFRAWLRPNTPEGRIAPVDDAAARGLLVALNWVIVLPLIGHHIARTLLTTGASREVVSAAVIIYAPLIAACLLWVVWHWHKEMAAWLSAMVSERKIGRQLKLDTAHRWWMFGLTFYALLGLAAAHAALWRNTGRGLA